MGSMAKSVKEMQILCTLGVRQSHMGTLKHSLDQQRWWDTSRIPHLKERKLQHKTMFSFHLHFLKMELVRRPVTRTMDLSLSVFTSEPVRRLVTLASGSRQGNVFYVWKVQYPAVVKDRV